MRDKDYIEVMCDKVVEELSQHCESVRIFVTYETEDGNADTASLTDGAGNIYAQFGQIREWLKIQDKRAENSILKADKQ